MKLCIASDIHGSAAWCEKLLSYYRKSGAEKLLLLGDVLYHGPRNDLPSGHKPKSVVTQLNEISDEILCIRGNCDAFVDNMVLDFDIDDDYLMLDVDGYSWFVTHGDMYDETYLPPAGTGNVLIYGHTHRPFYGISGDMHCINPGSVGIPRGGSCHSCCLYENGRFSFIDLETEEVWAEYTLPPRG